MAKKINIIKTADLQSQYDNDPQYLTANNINQIVTVINENYDNIGSLSSKIDNIDQFTWILDEDIQNLSTSFDDYKPIIEGNLTTNYNVLIGLIDTLSTKFDDHTKSIPPRAATADKATTAENANSAKNADVASSLDQSYINQLSASIESSIRDTIITDSGQITVIPTLQPLRITQSESLQISYDGTEITDLSSIISSIYAQSALTAEKANIADEATTADNALNSDKVGHQISFKDLNGQIIRYDGSETADFIQGIYYALSSTYSVEAEHAVSADTADKVKSSLRVRTLNGSTRTFDGSETIDISNDGIYQAYQAHIASRADIGKKVQNALKIKVNQGDTQENYISYDGSTPIIINQVCTAAVALRLAPSDDPDNPSTDPNAMQPLTYIEYQDGSEIALNYNGSAPASLSNIHAKSSDTAKKFQGTLSIQTDQNTIIPYNGQSDLTLSSVLSSSIANQATSANYAMHSILAERDNLGNIISQTYQLKNKTINQQNMNVYGKLYYRLAHENAGNSKTNDFPYSGQANFTKNYRYYQSCSFDKFNGLILNNGRVYPVGRLETTNKDTTYSPPPPPCCYFNVNAEINSQYIEDLSNISYVYMYNRCCAAIDNNGVGYVWGKQDNHWFGLYNLIDPSQSYGGNIDNPYLDPDVTGGETDGNEEGGESGTPENENPNPNDSPNYVQPDPINVTKVPVTCNLKYPTIINKFYSPELNTYANQAKIIKQANSLDTNKTSLTKTQADALTTQKLVNNTQNILNMDINNPSLQSITLINPIPKLVKIIKGGTSCGALALDANGIIYGCGKNKNQMFGSEFKNNQVFETWFKLPINYFISGQTINGVADSIADIKTAHTDYFAYNMNYTNTIYNKDLFVIITKQGRVYINGEFGLSTSDLSKQKYSTTAKAIKLPLFTNQLNSYIFKTRLNPTSAINYAIVNSTSNAAQRSIELQYDPYFTNDIETKSKFSGWYMWGLINQSTKTFGNFSSVDIIPSGIIGYENSIGLVYNGVNIFTVTSSVLNITISAYIINETSVHQLSGLIDENDGIIYDKNRSFSVQIAPSSIFILNNESLLYSCHNNNTNFSIRTQNQQPTLLSDKCIVLENFYLSNIASIQTNKDNNDFLAVIATKSESIKSNYIFSQIVYNDGRAGLAFREIDAVAITGIKVNGADITLSTGQIEGKKSGVYKSSKTSEAVYVTDSSDKYTQHQYQTVLMSNNIVLTETQGNNTVTVNNVQNTYVGAQFKFTIADKTIISGYENGTGALHIFVDYHYHYYNINNGAAPIAENYAHPISATTPHYTTLIVPTGTTKDVTLDFRRAVTSSIIPNYNEFYGKLMVSIDSISAIYFNTNTYSYDMFVYIPSSSLKHYDYAYDGFYNPDNVKFDYEKFMELTTNSQ